MSQNNSQKKQRNQKDQQKLQFQNKYSHNNNTNNNSNNRKYNKTQDNGDNNYQKKNFKQGQSQQSKYDTYNRKRTAQEREDYYDDNRIAESVKNSLNEFFYYDQEKQKYFRKREEHKNAIWDGTEVGKIDQIEEIEIDNEEQQFQLCDMQQFEQQQIYLNPRDILYSYKKQKQLPNEFLTFYQLRDILNQLKNEYKHKYLQQNQQLDCPYQFRKQESKFININEFKGRVEHYDYVKHIDYTLMILAVKSETQNTISFIIISLNKFNQSQIIKLVPNIQSTQFIKVIIMNELKQIQNNNNQSQFVEDALDDIDYCLYITKKSIAIFKYELINIQFIQQTFVEQLNLDYDILSVEKFKNSQILIQTRKELRCYDIKQKINVFKIYFQNYNVLFMRLCIQNMIAIAYTESQKILVICLQTKRILFASILTNLSDLAILQEDKNKILFIYQRLKQTLFFLSLRKEGQKWNWFKIEQNQNQFSYNQPLKISNIQIGEQNIQALSNNIFRKNKIIGQFQMDQSPQLVTNLMDYHHTEMQQEEDERIDLLTFFQIKKTLFLIYYNDYQIQIQYSEIEE